MCVIRTPKKKGKINENCLHRQNTTYSCEIHSTWAQWTLTVILQILTDLHLRRRQPTGLLFTIFVGLTGGAFVDRFPKVVMRTKTLVFLFWTLIDSEKVLLLLLLLWLGCACYAMMTVNSWSIRIYSWCESRGSCLHNNGKKIWFVVVAPYWLNETYVCIYICR